YNLIYANYLGIAGSIDEPVSSAILNRWTPENPSNSIAGFTSTGGNTLFTSSQFIQDGSYLRMNNLALDYNFSSDIFGNTPIKSLRLYISAQNLFTITAKDFWGFDPQLHMGKHGNSASTDASNGLYFDFQNYPLA